MFPSGPGASCDAPLKGIEVSRSGSIVPRTISPGRTVAAETDSRPRRSAPEEDATRKRREPKRAAPARCFEFRDIARQKVRVRAGNHLSSGLTFRLKPRQRREWFRRWKHFSRTFD